MLQTACAIQKYADQSDPSLSVLLPRLGSYEGALTKFLQEGHVSFAMYSYYVNWDWGGEVAGMQLKVHMTLLINGSKPPL